MNKVIISYWVDKSQKCLFNLLKQMYSYDAGVQFSTVIVCNGGNLKPLHLPKLFKSYNIQILNRVNAGYNIAAWDYGWRNNQDSEYFLFLQDDCYVIRNGWLKAFLDKMKQSPQIGLVGERINWKITWSRLKNSSLYTDFLNKKDAKINAVEFMLDFLNKQGIPVGETGVHLQSIILFTSCFLLQKIGGFFIRETYAEAIASEIAISKKILSLGYQITKVASEPFYYIGHREWGKRGLKTNKLNQQ